MIPILQSTRNSRLTSFLKSYPTNRIGTGRISSLITNGVTIKPYVQYSDGWSVIFQNTVPVLHVMPLWTISCGMMVRRKAKFYARSVRLIFLQLRITVFQKLLSSSALIAITALFTRKTVNTSSSINV